MNECVKYDKDTSSRLIEDFDSDCSDWLRYSLYAYGDIVMYKGGIEAFANKYYRLINRHFSGESKKKLLGKIERTIVVNYANDSIHESFEKQKNEGFIKNKNALKK